MPSFCSATVFAFGMMTMAWVVVAADKDVASTHSLLRPGIRRETEASDFCPPEIPKAGTKCQFTGAPEFFSCKYDFILFPTASDDGTCTGEVTCSPSTFVNCGKDGFWEPPSVIAVEPCQGELPKNAFQSCDGCPAEEPEVGQACQDGISCGYYHFLSPTYQDDDTCTEPYSCTPTLTFACEKGVWGPPLSLSVQPCGGDVVPDAAFASCDPSRNDACPAEAPEPQSKCNRYANLPDCLYNYLKFPTVDPNGKCVRPRQCVPTTGCTCDENGQWQCWIADPPFCLNRKGRPRKRPFKTCEP